MGKVGKGVMAVAGAFAVGSLLMGGATANAEEVTTDEGTRVTAAPESDSAVEAQSSPFFDWRLIPSTSNRGTGDARITSNGTVQVRYGTYQGTQYGWARAVDAPKNWYVRFEIDLDGDRNSDWYSAARIGERNPEWTNGWPTSSSSDTAFRACLVSASTRTCDDVPSHRTGWW